MEDTIPERYEKNPLFVFLENYILDTLGVLEGEKVKLLSESVAGVFGGTAREWKGTLRKVFDLPADTDEKLRGLWRQRQEEAETTQTDMSVEDFARRVVDENYADVGQGE